MFHNPLILNFRTDIFALRHLSKESPYIFSISTCLRAGRSGGGLKGKKIDQSIFLQNYRQSLPKVAKPCLWQMPSIYQITCYTATRLNEKVC